MKKQMSSSNQVTGANWGTIGEGFLLALIMIVLFVLLPGIGGK